MLANLKEIEIQVNLITFIRSHIVIEAGQHFSPVTKAPRIKIMGTPNLLKPKRGFLKEKRGSEIPRRKCCQVSGGKKQELESLQEGSHQSPLPHSVPAGPHITSSPPTLCFNPL